MTAQQCIRGRRKARLDKRYKHKDPHKRAQRLREIIEGERARKARKGSKK